MIGFPHLLSLFLAKSAQRNVPISQGTESYPTACTMHVPGGTERMFCFQAKVFSCHTAGAL